MEFLLKDFERYLFSSIRKQIPEKTIKYSFIFDDKILLMRQSRKYYQVVASSSCGFEPVFLLKTLNVLYQTVDFFECLNMYKSYILRLLG